MVNREARAKAAPEHCPPPGWFISEEHPGYYYKELHHGNATILVFRPFLTPEEASKRDAEIIRAGEQYLAAIERRRKLNQEAV